MPIKTRKITATISEPDGDPVEGAKVDITLRGLGNGANGAVAPMTLSQLTNSSGIATFTLWENDLANSDTHYEITSIHPSTGLQIHKREVFVVGDSDADVKDLINVAPVAIDPNQALLNQIAIDRAAAAASALAAETSENNSQTSADSSATSAQAALDALDSIALIGASAFPLIFSQHVEVIQNVNRIIYLGPEQSPSEQNITYQVFGSSDISLNSNLATFNSANLGLQFITVVATDENNRSTEVVLAIQVVAISNEYELSNVVVS